ncbi:membrane metallo-endopeptidase-like 1 [Paramacrobiotus metropolitanus]|uniref:membrane metallo-endopeptidase-like 1 n=1 Tax=Paramacrobiotus metropolitanus TaxID=2943436 RepID=UPI00244593CF|nr:membrane metallo-endopeptidase-like 1 [Paramacrobiotus metropolitanus]
MELRVWLISFSCVSLCWPAGRFVSSFAVPQPEESESRARASYAHHGYEREMRPLPVAVLAESLSGDALLNGSALALAGHLDRMPLHALMARASGVAFRDADSDVEHVLGVRVAHGQEPELEGELPLQPRLGSHFPLTGSELSAPLPTDRSRDREEDGHTDDLPLGGPDADADLETHVKDSDPHPAGGHKHLHVDAHDLALAAEFGQGKDSAEKYMKNCKDGPPNIAHLEPSHNGTRLVATARKQDDCNDICISSSCVEIAATLLQSMDLRKDPCEDFYSYVCGNWDKNNPIPDDKSSYDTFTKMRDHLDVIVRGLLERPIAASDSKASAKAKKLYQSCVNEEIIERRGSEPLLRFLQDLGGWPVIDQQWNASGFHLEETIGRLRNMHNDILISLWIGPDGKNSSWNVLQIDQAEFGMPTREYFLDSNQLYRLAYLGLMTSIAELLAMARTRAMTDMEEILLFEVKLANISIAQEHRRNFSAIYEKLTIREMEAQVPQIKWRRYFEVVLNRSVSPNESLVVYAKDYFVRLGQLLDKTPTRTLANYLIWRIVQNRASNLDERFRSRRRVFSNLLLGNTKESPRWRVCVQYVNDNLGMALGAMFVREHFKEDSKEIAQLMIRELRLSFIELVDEVDWMEGVTKLKAKEKMNSMIDNIGYPDWIQNSTKLDQEYDGIDFDPEKYFENVVTCLRYLTAREREELWKPVNRSTWSTTPAVVNAFYSRTKNQIMFPAGILQPPFYNSHFPMTMNFGGIGVVVGHEISHGFDDKGRQFNKFGNLEQWWPPETERHFEQKARCLIEQYNKYQLTDLNLTVNGMQTQGENIADNAGIKLAYRSMVRWLSHNQVPRLPGLHHLSPHQLFFVNFAQVWCGSSRPEAMQFRLRTGVHPPGRFRVIGAVSNMHEFADAFHCPNTSPMNPPRKCQIW